MIVPASQQQNALWPLRWGGKGWTRGVLAARFSSALRCLLLTPLGSLIWAPDFGTTLHLLRTQHVTEEDAELSRVELSMACARWIPDIRIDAASVDQNPNDFVVTVSVEWSLPSVGPSGTREAILKKQLVTVEL